MSDQIRWVVAATLPEGVTVYARNTVAGQFGPFSDAWLFGNPEVAEQQAADARSGLGLWTDAVPQARAIQVTVPEPVFD